MPDDDEAINIAFDPPDEDRVYRNCLETCRRLGVEPLPREHAQGMIDAWNNAIADGRLVPPITQ